MSRLPHRLLVLALCAATVPLTGFTGNKGQELVGYVGAGIGRQRTAVDDDPYGEIGADVAFKFRHFPYSDLSGWMQYGASWDTYAQGGNFGNMHLTAQFMGGVLTEMVQVGGGFVIWGELTGTGPLAILPSVRVRLGRQDEAHFTVGMMDRAPYWSSGGLVHWEFNTPIPWRKIWAPRVKIGGRINIYAFGERVPIELFGGVEARIGRHVRIGIDATLGDGGGGPPTFSGVARVGFAVGRGTKSDVLPQPTE